MILTINSKLYYSFLIKEVFDIMLKFLIIMLLSNSSLHCCLVFVALMCSVISLVFFSLIVDKFGALFLWIFEECIKSFSMAKIRIYET